MSPNSRTAMSGWPLSTAGADAAHLFFGLDRRVLRAIYGAVASRLSDMNHYLAVILAIIAVLLLGEFAVQFADWNKEQACASAGRRNCGGTHIFLTH
jgi:hypothetical protein